jgi:hypothetical protein
MTPSEIIMADSKRQGVDPKVVLDTCAKLIKGKLATIIQENNSVLLLTFIDRQDVELHLFTADSPLTLAKSLMGFINTIKQSELRRVYGKADNSGILEMLKRVGVNVMQSDKPQFNWMAEVHGAQ